MSTESPCKPVHNVSNAAHTGRETLFNRAETLIPKLREQQDEADARGYFSDAILQALIDAGFYRMLMPRMFGGYESDLDTFFEVVARISEGHPSSGWCFCLSASHCAVVAAHFEPSAQQELLGPHGEFRSPHRSVPAGTIDPVPGGYRISGRWSFSSGIPVSTHFAGNTFLKQEQGPPLLKTFFVRRDQVTVLDDWGGDNALGMQGSGSNTVVLDDVFVPEHHVVGGDMLLGTTIDFAHGTPGTRLHGNPFYLGIFGGVFHLCFTAILLGTARAALAEFVALAGQMKVYGAPDKVMTDDPDTRRVIGRAATLIDGAQALRQGGTARCEALFARWAEDRSPITPQETMAVWATARQGAQMAAEAVQLLFQHLGPRAAARGARLQRYWRDVQMYQVHPASQPWVEEARGEAELGLEISKFRSRR